MAKLKMTAAVTSQVQLAEGIYDLRLAAGEIAAQAVPGQFVSLYSKDGSRLLPRPISLCGIDKEKGELRLVYRVAGAGTKEFSALTAGDTIDVLGPLGNGFPLLEGKKAFLIGGGIGITYDDEQPVPVADYIDRVFHRITAWKTAKHPGKPFTIVFEPGRSISGNGGLLLTEVQYLKTNAAKHFAIVDAAMNDLMRPSLYEAWHGVLPVTKRTGDAVTYDIVGPVCESGDWLARQRKLTIEAGDLLAIMSAGAYGMAMSSNYNTRGRAAEVLVSDGRVHLIRKRERPEELFALESVVS